MRLSAEKKEEEEDQEPMDLDLEQMFEVKLPEFMCETCEAMNVDRVSLNLSGSTRHDAKHILHSTRVNRSLAELHPRLPGRSVIVRVLVCVS